MITIFSIPKPFDGHIGLIQRNALASWRRLGPDVQILLFGEELGIREAAERFAAEHFPEIDINSYGTPLVSSAFAQARTHAKYDVIVFTNADMMYDESLLSAVSQVKGANRYVMSGQRCNVDVTRDLMPTSTKEWSDFWKQSYTRSSLHGPSAMDYFVFPKNLDLGMPGFAIGRVGWDGWMVWNSRKKGIPLIDATGSIRAIHQNHSYASLKLGYQHWQGPERDLNLKLAGGLGHLLTLREASHHLVQGRLVRPKGMSAVTSRLAPFFIYQKSLALKRRLQQALHR